MQTHAHRTFENGATTCECGAKFDDDDAWRHHYEQHHDEAERATLEGREAQPADGIDPATR